jgi:hypothetical protein
MTEVKSEGNLLNSLKYPDIADATLNFVIPCHNDEEENAIKLKIKNVFRAPTIKQFNTFKLKHHFNGYFLVIQTSLNSQFTIVPRKTITLEL